MKVLSSLTGSFLWLYCIALSFSCDKPPEHIITDNNYDSLHLAPYVEPGFPFISTSIDLRDMGQGLPARNVVSRGIVMMLGHETYACFDTDLLRWSVGWTGDFISLTGMAQISYADFFNKKNKFPKVLGNPKIATGLYPGWQTSGANYEDPRPMQSPDQVFPWGPVSVDIGRWEGLYVQDSTVILSYTVGSNSILEKPGAITFDGEKAFVRQFQIEPHSDDFFLQVAEVSNGQDFVQEDGWAYIIQGENQDSVTAVAVSGNAGKVVGADNRYLSVEFGASGEKTQATVVIWKGPIDLLPQFKDQIGLFSTPEEIIIDKKRNHKHWPDKVYTGEIRSPDTASFVTDQLLLPIPNPWQRNIRIMDIAFFKDGRGAVVSFSGDVWLIDGIGSKYMTWSRFASGLNEPMSIEILRDTIYVFDRLGITRFHDYNGDGEADYYENFSNIADQSMETREWAADMKIDPAGGFYLAKGGSLVGGPHIGPTTVKGFNRGSQYDGSVLHISEDGRQLKVIATGMRGPYLGINPVTGMLTASDQQGNYMPSTPIYHIQEGDYYGVPSTAHSMDTTTIAPPLLWIPHNIDPSGLGEVWAISDQMGPLNGQLIHISFTRPGLFKVLIDTTSQTLQGGLSFIQAHYPTPLAKGAIHPEDGQAYFVGFNIWGSTSKGISSLLRLRYTGQDDYLPTRFEAGRQGLMLRFGIELDSASVANIGNFQVKRYNYLRTEEYGSGHYRLDGSPGEENLPVISSHLSSDKKAVLLIIPNMVPVEQMELTYHINTANQVPLADHFSWTVHQVEDLDLNKSGFPFIRESDLVMSADELAHAGRNELPITVERGEEIFHKMACAGCHSPGTRTEGLYGPPFQDLFGSEQKFNDGTTRIVDEAYLRESILEPDKQVVKGYDSEMPSFLGILSDSDIESIILYIQSLSKNKLQ